MPLEPFGESPPELVPWLLREDADEPRELSVPLPFALVEEPVRPFVPELLFDEDVPEFVFEPELLFESPFPKFVLPLESVPEFVLDVAAADPVNVVHVDESRLDARVPLVLEDVRVERDEVTPVAAAPPFSVEVELKLSPVKLVVAPLLLLLLLLLLLPTVTVVVTVKPPVAL